ncbi:MAG: Gfo/Idh/MocA family protein [Armatimonadota bacterium]
MTDSLTRRELLERAAIAGATVAVGGFRLAEAGPAPKRKSPNEKLNIAGIGVGGMGANDINAVSTENIVALCDVDDAYAAKTFQRYPKAKKYHDFREMLEKEKSIDAVVISTPDHVHAVATAMAIKLGKHVYCQKPLTRTVSEARAITELARKYKVTTQMGNQGHPSYVRLVELIQSNVIGPVTEVHVWTDRPIWPQGLSRPAETPPVPPTLKWDLWLGPIKERPYHPAYHPFAWRGWWDFGTGALGDMACHLMDGAFWALKLKYPTTVEAEGEPRLPESGPLWSIVRYEFPRRGDMPPVRLTWYDGGKLPSADLLEGVQLPKGSNGSLFIGEKGKILVEHGAPPRLLPESKFADVKLPDPYLPRVDDHYQEWVRACKTGGPTGSNFDYAGPMTEAILLGNVAFRVGQKITYDARRMKAVNCPEADRYINHEYRKGWSL